MQLSWFRNSRRTLASFTIQLDGEEAELVEEFVMMVEMGFFVLTGQRYQMAIPEQLDMDVVKRAALKFAKTEDEESYLHPVYLVATMPYAEAEAWQERLYCCSISRSRSSSCHE